MTKDDARARLITQLRGAYSGELAAGFAYRGHWRSISDPAVKARIREIEADEWHHRQLVGGLLHQLGAKPSMAREVLFWCIGRVLGLSCFVTGWFLPMYGAGKLERGNIVEYEDAAVFASRCDQSSMIDCLLEMAEVEWDHELYFRSCVDGHRLLRVFALWPAPPPRSSIRESYEASELTRIAAR